MWVCIFAGDDTDMLYLRCSYWQWDYAQLTKLSKHTIFLPGVTIQKDRFPSLDELGAGSVHVDEHIENYIGGMSLSFVLSNSVFFSQNLCQDDVQNSS
jgi:hypothetical protein